MSDVQCALPKDDPRVVAWKAYQASDGFANTRNWALHNAHVDGSLWAAFVAGFEAAHPTTADHGVDVGESEALDSLATRSSLRFLRQFYEKRRCDSEAVADCVRCNVMFLVSRLDRALRTPTPTAEEDDA